MWIKLISHQTEDACHWKRGLSSNVCCELSQCWKYDAQSKVYQTCGFLLVHLYTMDAPILLLSQYIDIMIHLVCRIALEDAMGRTLRNNYCTTDSLLQLASQHMPKLKSFVYVSSAFVNMNVPNFSIVTEAIHPLMHGDQEVRWKSQHRRRSCMLALWLCRPTHKEVAPVCSGEFLLSRNRVGWPSDNLVSGVHAQWWKECSDQEYPCY